MRNPLIRILAMLFAFSLVAAACGGSDSEGSDTGSDTSEESTDESTEETEDESSDDAMDDDSMEDDAMAGVDLSAVCPSTIVIQKDWNPESEHGALYEMVGDDYEIDTNILAVRGNLVSGGHDTGVTIEVRSGGPAIGFQQVTAQMYQDDSITFGYVTTDEAVENFSTLPTRAFVAPLDKNPQMIMWDPETYPEAASIADLPDEAFVRYFGGASYIPYLLAEGILVEEQLDDTYDGTPAIFVAEGGALAQQGFASAEPFIYENEVPEWAKPVSYELIHDTGYAVYAAAISVRAAEWDEMTPCMEALTPVIQQAQVDFITNPDETIGLILEAVEAYDNGWIYSEGVANYSVETMLADGLVGNGEDDTLGNFDMDRMAGVVELLTTNVFTDAAGVTPDDLVSNEFIDESIGL